ncbi:MAG: hypothetical protein A3C85_03455 [Candidatus Doudnabacteria bacterium RIFCSPHIGHO2_02_FULL_48_21]|uniref:tRNA-dihydrouridine synthase n=1 Tax=Candidatus Doudnabacteria bacterium RIFCSPLOWO2_02_FULL_48_13 TaxID=1817845 RepID=A0A1F5QB03_9BACT|nr:MAG: hypothetical protein A3K05_03665 [Candidatus Doudnabacteria bacterium RIFCSPHIGHO2_01_48_18]OGE77335.1 MAG: hypothetical protein A2668_01255 [Candidatus Doudnabacteria bacterium RIFCSPHIGHO2_01_FULL_48_180]OGE91298.1 MAG: hypothetical protein A3F44_03240 [Candidatus Doudnabacteria bacterium RIFCSPHIGHO2_12_FULL_47_25]OGE93296.1 MAG: hypothetical protein A3C85_03455 [Candidatus Doudnabacteria bacterium RIFCSPHIGHO2_02_FULL_48_21]OGE97798.1 MAG: hypothetical protein A3A83_04355 [Candidatu
MKANFWKMLKRPIFVLAPLANVTDAAFRFIIAKYGKPDVMWTEFVSCDGLVSAGKEKLVIDLKYTEGERPIVAQFFGSKPENFYKCAVLARELEFDGIDINMGCPDRAVEKQGAGAALCKNPKLAAELIQAAKEGAESAGGRMPVSAKIRLGYNKDELDNWLPKLLEAEPAVITLHARTRKEMSLVPAHWDRIADAVKIRNDLESQTLIFGNGDVKDRHEAELRVRETGCDGVMIGRGIFGNPWLFSSKRDYKSVPLEEKLAVMLEHTFLFEKIFKGVKNFDLMKKHYKAYVTGFDGAKELRVMLMAARNVKEVQNIVELQLAR